MKILHIIPTLKRAGAERLVIDICNTIINNNLAEVLLVVMYKENEFTELTKNINIKYCSSRINLSITGKTKVDLNDFIKIVEDFKPDIIHSHLYEAEMLSRWKLFPDIKYVSHCHDNMVQLNKILLLKKWNKKKITDYYERKKLLKQYKACNNNFIAISNDTEYFLKNNLSKNLKNIFLLHNAIDYNKFKRSSSNDFLSIDKKNIRLVNIGSFVAKKNQTFLVDVVSMLKLRGYEITLDLLGNGPDKSNIEQKIIEKGLTKNIFCRGSVGNVEEYLHNSLIYVHSATYEPFGLVLLEAMAAGLPVVCLDGKGNRDIIKNGYNGFMIEKPDANLFAEKIIELISNKKLYSEMSENAVKFASDYDIEKYVKKLTDFYCKILKEK